MFSKVAARCFLLVARSGAALETVAARVRAEHGVSAAALVADLEEPASIECVAAAAQARFGRVDLLVNNAGYGAHGRFETIDPQRQLGQIRLNVSALVALTTRLLPELVARGGGIINVASTASFQPVPFMAVYGATKAFVLSFSEALAEEYRGRGLRVLALCPGATSTNFFKTAGEGARQGGFRTPVQVVQTALRAYDRGATYVVDAPANRVLAFLARVLPRPLMARAAGTIMRPRN